MKCNYKRNKPQIKGNDFKTITEEFKELFTLWLNASGINEDEFLECGMIKPFKIHKTEESNAIQVFLTFGGIPLGQPFISSTDKNIFMVDTTYMLLHIAGKLDKADGGDYFYNITREFAKNELLYKMEN
jgi:hypothetical protein